MATCWRAEMFIFSEYFTIILEICFKMEGCEPKQATMRYVLIGPITLFLLYFYWIVKSITLSKGKIH